MRVTILILIVGFLLNTSASAYEDCCGADEFPSGFACPTCVSEDCTRTAGTEVTTEGTPGIWTPVAGATITQDNCADDCPDDEPATVNYTQSTGKSYEICFGAGISIPGLSLDTNGCYSVNTTTSESVTVSVTAGACAQKKKKAYVRTVPYTVTRPVTCEIESVWRDDCCDPDSPPGACTQTINETKSGEGTASGDCNEYKVVSTNPPCDPDIECCCDD